MKKIFGSIVFTSLSPLLGIVSCQTINVEDYQVDMDDFLEIISMEGVQYLQYTQDINQDNVKTFMSYELSPTVYHIDMTSDLFEMNIESYTYFKDGSYWKINREHSSTVWTDPEQVEESSFTTPQKIAETIRIHYQEAIDNEAPIVFNDKDLNYQTSYTIEGTLFNRTSDVQWSFYKNKLTSFSYVSVTKDPKTSQIISTETNKYIDFKYDQYTPDVPVLSKY